VIDTVIRYVPGVLGDAASVADESHSAPGRLEYPQYTRPRVFRDMAVPEILLSGNHQEVDRWRREQSEARSRQRRGPGLETETPQKGDDHEKPLDATG
jgi:tRNA (guanine37-N1)-methyltransferase